MSLRLTTPHGVPRAPAEDEKSAYPVGTIDAAPSAEMPTVRSRTVLHFPGFEPLTDLEHHQRYRRAAEQSAGPWDLRLHVHNLRRDGPTPAFDVECESQAGRTVSRIHICDHGTMVRQLSQRPALKRLASGFMSAAEIALLQGGLHRYLLNAWRFGLFFLFPFVLIALIGAISLAAVLLVFAWTGGVVATLATVAVVIGALVFIWPSWLRRMHVPLLLSDWTFALMLGRLNDPSCRQWLDDLATRVRPAFDEACDEIVITSHSMGSNVAVHVLGVLLEREPDLLRGKKVVFVTLGGAVLQCALLASASVLRARVGAIARQEAVEWIDVQCLTDPVNFYGVKVVAVAGHPGARQARIVTMRIRKMISTERYRRIKWQLLRRHRQYVLGSDNRHVFDFTCLTAGPRPASTTGRPIAQDGIGDRSPVFKAS